MRKLHRGAQRRIVSVVCLLVMIAMANAAAIRAEDRAEVVDIGERRELFVDREIIGRLTFHAGLVAGFGGNRDVGDLGKISDIDEILEISDVGEK